MPEEQRNEGFKIRKIERSGFTLIELLVVMSIISVLMSILLPGLSRAREQAKRTHCSANLKNLTWGWYMYAGEYDGRLCSADTEWNSPGNNWVADGPMIPGNTVGGTEQAIVDGVLWPYVRTYETYKCLSSRRKLVRNYCLSRAMNGKTCNCEDDNVNPFTSLSSISRLADKMVFVDAESLENWIDGSFSPVVDITAEPPEWYSSPSRNITARHSDGCNLSFADAHCEYWRYGDPRTVRLANWEIGPAEASADNPDLLRMVESLRGVGQ